MPIPDNVIDRQLYSRVKSETKKRFKSWPSAYASAYLVKEYKRRGGRYKRNTRSKDGLTRWFKEQWVDTCHYPKIVPCGREKGGYRQKVSKYPYCRPLKRVTKQTPRTVRELSPAQLRRRCQMKRRSPRRRMTKTN